MKRPSLTDSFAFAFDGILRTLVGERNMKIHWISAMTVMMVGMALPLSLPSRAVLLFTTLLVLALEVLNAALEGIVDLATAEWTYSAKLAKDAAAGAVLVVAFGGVLLLIEVLMHNWGVVRGSGPAIVRTIAFGVPCLFALGLTLWMPAEPGWLRALLAAAACAAFLPLALFSKDPVFTGGGALLLVGALIGRAREARLMDRVQPTVLTDGRASRSLRAHDAAQQ